ncbi:hypothetical protein GGS26DRAFT_592883 [Hypomontagnella submonticulosa]|nr:hypothetical protein GGS26DRAFT_592883 [Hypomontagnella submonticulosa]
MKFTTVISALCLWQAAGATPLQPQTEPLNSLLAQDTHYVESTTQGHKLAHSTHHDASKKQRCNGTADTSSTAPTSSNTPLVTSGKPHDANDTNTPTPASGTSNSTAYCQTHNSTFVDATVADSPPAADCLAIADHAIPALEAKGLYAWTYSHADWAQRNTTGMKQLAGMGACAFGVVAGDMKADNVKIGTVDAAAVIREAVGRFAKGTAAGATALVVREVPGNARAASKAGKLDVAGAFACGDAGTVVNWALYHS